jgi:transcriptional regulator of arginine metabolism
MITRNKRLKAIMELVSLHSSFNQKELLKRLHEKGFLITQATLSRDIKQLKIIKSPDEEGNYVYTLPKANNYSNRNDRIKEVKGFIYGFIFLEFSNNLGVIKTRSGYAMGIASDIDTKVPHVVLGTIAGDDTILLIPREGVSRKDIISALTEFIPGMKMEEDGGE